MINKLLQMLQANEQAFSITTAKGYQVTVTKLDPLKEQEFGIYVSTSSNSNTMSRVGTITSEGVSLLRKAFYEV